MLPGGFQTTIVLSAIGLLLVLGAPSRLNVTEQLLKSAFSSVLKYQIEVGPEAGLFRATSHSGTILHATDDSALLALSVVRDQEAARGKEMTKEQKNNLKAYADELLTKKNAQHLHEGLVIYKVLELPLTPQTTKSVTEQILKMQEGSSGFRLQPAFSASILGSFHALNALQLLNVKLDAGKEKDVVSFVMSLYDSQSGAFAATKKTQLDAVVDQTFYADRVLSLFNVDPKTYLTEHTLAFIAGLQKTNGGVTGSSNEAPSAEATIQALYLFGKLKKISNEDLSGFNDVAARGYLRECISANGIHSNPKAKPSLAPAYFLSFLVNDQNMGDLTSRSVMRTIQGIGFFLIVAGIFSVLDLTKFVDWRGSWYRLLLTGFMLYLASASAEANSAWCVVICLLLASILFVTYFELCDSDIWGTREKEQCQLWLITAACLASAIHLAAFFFVVYFWKNALLQWSGWIFLMLIDVPAALISTYASAFFMDVRRRMTHGYALFYSAGYLSWVSSIIFQYSFLYIRNDWSVIYEWASARGLLTVLTVIVPVTSQFICTSCAAYGVSLLNNNSAATKRD